VEAAERYRDLNRALPADELTPIAERLARCIASFPAHTIAHLRAAIILRPFPATPRLKIGLPSALRH
jgi:hypothetical protein